MTLLVSVVLATEVILNHSRRSTGRRSSFRSRSELASDTRWTELRDTGRHRSGPSASVLLSRRDAPRGAGRISVISPIKSAVQRVQVCQRRLRRIQPSQLFPPIPVGLDRRSETMVRATISDQRVTNSEQFPVFIGPLLTFHFPLFADCGTCHISFCRLQETLARREFPADRTVRECDLEFKF